mmetsp:Transcript_19066/g.44274  ORF Transcript_19066/g.44274 Transcript_19066/m.44274 type:complete len:214 (+) Transcript_19066:1-642(+)
MRRPARLFWRPWQRSNALGARAAGAATAMQPLLPTSPWCALGQRARSLRGLLDFPWCPSFGPGLGHAHLSRTVLEGGPYYLRPHAHTRWRRLRCNGDSTSSVAHLLATPLKIPLFLLLGTKAAGSARLPRSELHRGPIDTVPPARTLRPRTVSRKELLPRPVRKYMAQMAVALATQHFTPPEHVLTRGLELDVASLHWGEEGRPSATRLVLGG